MIQNTNRMESKSLSPSEVRLLIASFFAVIFLSLDTINPVKVICSILGISTAWAALASLLAIIGIVYANASDIAYFCTKIFMTSILSIFFSSVEVIGRQNIPLHGPIIFTGNHMNQFVDAGVILVSCPQRVGFLIAEKSYHTQIVGGLAKAIGCYPVSRPQDHAKKGVGRVYLLQFKLVGEGTEFTKISKGDKLRLGRSPDAYRVKEIISDTELVLADDVGEPSPLSEDSYQGVGNWTTYDVLAFIDQGKMFYAVQDALSKGHNLGIFPEGGSHDNTDLLPLKAGVSAITFGVLERYGVNVPIVPVGLNYFRGHRFRGRVVVEFGEPIRVTQTLHDIYKQSKRTAYTTLLSEVEDGMRSTIVTAPTYEELRLIHTTRRLYQKSNVRNLNTTARQDLARRFAAAYRMLKEKYGEELPQDMKDIQSRIEKYQNGLDELGLRDYQVVNNAPVDFSQTVFTAAHGFFIFALASVPTLILNAPVGLAAKLWAKAKAQEDLKASRVKIAARDVLLSKKITFSLVAVPALWLTYAILLMLFSKLHLRTIIVLLLVCPLFSYMGVRAVESGMTDIKDLRPAFMRLLPDFRRKVQELADFRADLVRDLRAAVKKHGPTFGPLYFERSSSWEQTMRKSRSSNQLAEQGKKE